MAATTVAFETGHEEMIHDAQLDYYGKRLATASSDRSIRIFDVSGDEQKLLAQLKGHDGPVWQVSWGHPKFGSLLASCGYDRRLVIWKEEEGGENKASVWSKVFEEISFKASVNSVAWAPHDFGLSLAAACADGTITILTYRDNTWDRQVLDAHPSGANAVSWAPALPSGALLDPNPNQAHLIPVKRFVSGGCDGRVKIWKYSPQENKWSEETLGGHSDWVRDVAWAPSIGLPTNTIASCSEDKTLIIWTEEKNSWKQSQKLEFAAKVWKLSWSVMGNILAVSQGDNKVSLWKETLDGDWKNLTQITEAGVEAGPSGSSSVIGASAEDNKSDS